MNKLSQEKHLLMIKDEGKPLSSQFFENKIESKLDRLKWFSTTQAAEYLNTSPAGIRNRIYRGQIQVYKPFGRYGRSYFLREQLDQLLEGSQL